MGRCELLVTKPGALTCTEAIVMNKPMVLVNTLPGQERANAAFLSGLGCAEWVKRGELAETVRYILANPEKRKQMENACGTSHVESAGEMYEAAIREFPTASAGILCAAVADFTPETVAGHKIKREKDNLILQLKPTQDIAAALGNRKKDGQTLVGFALETNDETKNAQRKLERKNLDFIVLNSLNDQGAGFRCDTNKITIIDRQGATPYPLKSKQEVARDIIDRLVNNK